jgi:hypothetical protein
MRSKIRFLREEGLTPQEILAVHAQGMTGYGDPEKLARKVADADRYRSGYVRRGMKAVDSPGE